MDTADFLSGTREKFDIVFLDPPYNQGILEKILPLVSEHMKDGGKVICEHEQRLVLPEKVGLLHLKKVYKYGKIEVSQFVYDENCYED